MKKILLSGFICLVFSISLIANQISSDLALKVAENFIFERLPLNEKAIVFPLNIYEEYYNGELVYYNIELSNSGFVIISADDDCVPILAYSLEPSEMMSGIPTACKSWLDHYAEQILTVKNENLKADEKIHSQWEKYSSSSFMPEPMESLTGIGPLLTSKWGQRVYYNAFCPNDPDGPGGRAIAGCVAIAMAQVMYYYRFPVSGEGSHGYMSGYGYEFADYENSIYEWDAMVNQIYNKSNPEIAELVYHVGVSVDMNYGPGSSGSLTEETVDALKTYFRYDESIEYVTHFDYGNPFFDTVIANLNKKQIVLYRGGDMGSAHSFVCDGYQDSSYFHFNWGWNGSFDGFYHVENLNPNVYDFTFNQGAVVNIYPREEYPEYCQGEKVLSASRGTFTDGSGPENYQNNQLCKWLISPDENDITNIQLWFTRFNTNLNEDIVRVYDGSTTSDALLGEYSGSETPTFLVSSGNEVLIVFESDNGNGSDGWEAEYLAYSEPFCEDGETFIEMSRTHFSDGSGPYHYIDMSDCTWFINPQSDEQDSISSVQLYFHSIDIEEGDTLFVFDGEGTNAELLASVSGNEIPDTIETSGNRLFLNFITDDEGSGNGFSAAYQSMLPLYCHDTLYYTEKTGIITDGSGTKKYGPNSNCYWQIESDDAQVISIDFLEFDLEYGYDQLKFYDANKTPPQLVGTYWGQNIPQLLNIYSDKVLVNFKSDESLEYNGWKIEYTALAPGIFNYNGNDVLSLSPVPAHNEVKISTAYSMQNLNYKIYSCGMEYISGGVIPDLKKDGYILNIASLNPGLYFIIFSCDSKTFATKLITY